MADENTPEITLETIADADPTNLTEEQSTFIKENADNLTDEQRETFKDVLEKKEEEEEEDDSEPETRTKSKEKKEKKETTEEKEEEDDIDEDDEKTIGKIVDKKLKGVAEQLKEVQRLKDETEVDAFVRAKPEYSKYRGTILKYLSHDAYKNIPVHNIAAIVSSRDQQKIGAAKEREAAKKATGTKTPGSTVRQPAGKTDWSKATKEEFEAQKSKVLGQQG